jgi:hypothetical protein
MTGRKAITRAELADALAGLVAVRPARLRP